MKVKDLMSKKVITVSPDAPFALIWKTIFRSGIHGLPVVDKDKTLTGIISETDLLTKIYPSYGEYMDDFRSASNFEEMEETIREIRGLKAKYVMSRNIYLAHPEDPILRALSKMIIRQVRQLPIIDEKKKLIGTIAKADILDCLFEKYLHLSPEPKKKEKKTGKKKKTTKKT